MLSKKNSGIFALAMLFVLACTLCSAASKTFVPGHYVYASGATFANAHITNYLNANSATGGVVFRGVQRAYYWSDLEPTKGDYKFNQIDTDIATIDGLGRNQKLVIQLSYKSFNSGQYEFPGYIHDNGEGIYGDPASGGTGNGYYVTDVGSHYPYIWNENVQARMQALLQKLGEHLDSNATLQCVNMCESASGQASVGEEIYGNAIKKKPH